MNLEKKIQKTKLILDQAESLFILTGAGISAASGVPTFRGSKTSIWKQRHLLKYAMADIFINDPVGAWQAHEAMRLLVGQHRPNHAHRSLHRICEFKPGSILFTQNVDGFHDAVGHKACELHGNINRLACTNGECGYCQTVSGQSFLTDPRCPKCGSWLRHDAVLFGEKVHYAEAFEKALERADAILLIGTSGFVTDTKGIAKFARARKIPVVEINPSCFTPATLWTTISIRKNAEDVLPQLAV